MTTSELAAAVGGANALTRRWVASLGESNAVLSGAGAWPVLAAALAGAEGPARTELEEALQISREGSGAGLRALSGLLEEAEGLGTALALWTAPTIEVRPAFRAELGAVETGPLPSQTEADAWVSLRTGELLTQCPVTIDESIVLLLLGIVTADGTWARRFADATVRWQDGHVDGVRRTDPDAAVADLLEATSAVGREDSVSRVRCTTTEGFEVHLLGGGERMPAAEVLTRGIDALTGDERVRPVTDLSEGERAGMIRLVVERGAAGQDGSLAISLPRFSLTQRHDLIAQAELFGLGAASDPARSHFPLISDTPLTVQSAAQDALAVFSTEGFRAAAVTAIGMARTAAPMPSGKVRRFVADHDRPFGFLLVEPETGLVLFAGWVAEPTSGIS